MRSEPREVTTTREEALSPHRRSRSTTFKLVGPGGTALVEVRGECVTASAPIRSPTPAGDPLDDPVVRSQR